MRNEYDFTKGKRGPVIPPDPNKVRINIPIDTDIIDYFKQCVNNAEGGNYQAMINNVLKEYVKSRHESLNENTLRRVIREELQAVYQ